MKTPWSVAGPIASEIYDELRLRTIFECSKWDAQYEDVATLAPYAIVLERAAWEELSKLAEALAQETLAAERELLEREPLQRRLGLGRAIERQLAPWQRTPPACEMARVLRFDFHSTVDGWRISEVNSDVPGGFIESSGFSELVRACFPELDTAGNVRRAYVTAVQAALPRKANVGLLHATAYTDDRQVMIYLAKELADRGFNPFLVSPADLAWRNGRASIVGTGEELDGILRFFPAEWLPNLPRRASWGHFFRGAQTLLSNPATALLTQSKRFPLVWDQLETPLPAWRELLPATRDACDIPWRDRHQWVLKPSLGRVGELVGIRGVNTEKEWRAVEKRIRWERRYWIAQERFEATSIDVGGVPVYPSLGVFVIGGRAAGIYGRVASRPLIDARASDVAVLVRRVDDGRKAA
ncbi:MAG: glutathionylspermidine synthase family protein [Acidobacteriota bacterium]